MSTPNTTTTSNAETAADAVDTSARVAAPPAVHVPGPVTLINSFDVPAGRDDVFREHWHETSAFFRAQPGFVDLRMHRAVSPAARYRFVNVVVWESAELFGAAHQDAEFHRLVAQPSWQEFPNSPALYEVVDRYSAAR